MRVEEMSDDKMQDLREELAVFSLKSVRRDAEHRRQDAGAPHEP